MRSLIFISLLSFSFTSQAGLKDTIWGLIDKVKIQIGFGETASSIELPDIPQPVGNPTDLSVYKRNRDKLYPANEQMLAWSVDKKKKLNIGYVNELFSVVQLRSPGRDEFSRWYNILQQGSSREGIYRALTVDDYYRSLEGRGASLTDQTVDFTSFYLKKYLQKKAQSDLLKQMTVYGIKKIIVDSTLKTLEVLSQNPENFFAWYAVFSEDMAIQFPSVWKYSLRGNKSRDTHYQWAKQTPYQLIQSEVIIKLHKVYNYLGRLTN